MIKRNSQQGKLFGVCAGWANFLHQDVTVIRIVIIIFMLIPIINIITFINYFMMAMILEDESAPAVETIKTPSDFLDDMETFFKVLDTNVTDLENYVTSDAFEFQCKLWALKTGA
jgi:phage shock protein C